VVFLREEGGGGGEKKEAVRARRERRGELETAAKKGTFRRCRGTFLQLENEVESAQGRGENEGRRGKTPKSLRSPRKGTKKIENGLDFLVRGRSGSTLAPLRPRRRRIRPLQRDGRRPEGVVRLCTHLLATKKNGDPMI
jgi:hypothetical protein